MKSNLEFSDNPLINAFMNDLRDKQRAEALDKGQMTLGRLIEELQGLNPDIHITFDDGSNPGEFMSYRGYYEQLGVDTQEESITVGEFLKRANAANGTEMHGYKGGEYLMGRHTLLNRAEYGCTGSQFMAIQHVENGVIIVTEDLN